jgi:hypothetical protein
MEAIHTSTHDDGNGTANEISDKITGKTGNETRQARTHTWAPGTSPKLLCENQVLIVFMTQDQLFYAYGQK